MINLKDSVIDMSGYDSEDMSLFLYPVCETCGDDCSEAEGDLHGIYTVPENDKESRLWRARQLALTRGGFVNADFRREFWPELVCASQETFSVRHSSKSSVDNFRGNKERDLIRRDVGRSVIFRYQHQEDVMPGGSTPKPSDVQRTLESVLNDSMSELLSAAELAHEHPRYYQGLHDIAGVLVKSLNYDENMASSILASICRSHLKDAVQDDNFQNLMWLLETFFLPVVATQDSELHKVLSEASEAIPLFNIILPWLITWFSHDVLDEEIASRLMDAFLASHPLLPFYFTIALMLHPKVKRDILFETENTDDYVSLHLFMQSLPSKLKPDFLVDEVCEEETTVQHVLDIAISIMERVPPASLVNLLETGLRNKELLDRASSTHLLNVQLSWVSKGAISNGCSDYDSKQKERSCEPDLHESQKYKHRSDQFHKAQLACGITSDSRTGVLVWRKMTDNEYFDENMADSASTAFVPLWIKSMFQDDQLPLHDIMHNICIIFLVIRALFLFYRHGVTHTAVCKERGNACPQNSLLNIIERFQFASSASDIKDNGKESEPASKMHPSRSWSSLLETHLGTIFLLYLISLKE